MLFLPFAVAALLGLAQGASFKYASDNHRQVVRDSEIVSAAFPDLPEVNLLSPAFGNSSIHQLGWQNGTNGPTSFAVMGKSLSRKTIRIQIIDCFQMTSFAALPIEIRGFLIILI